MCTWFADDDTLASGAETFSGDDAQVSRRRRWAPEDTQERLVLQRDRPRILNSRLSGEVTFRTPQLCTSVDGFSPLSCALDRPDQAVESEAASGSKSSSCLSWSRRHRQALPEGRRNRIPSR